MKKTMLWLLAALVAACLALGPALAEEDEVLSAPVDEAVEELGEGALYTGEVETELAPEPQGPEALDNTAVPDEGEMPPAGEVGMPPAEEGDPVPIDAAHFPDAGFRQFISGLTPIKTAFSAPVKALISMGSST